MKKRDGDVSLLGIDEADLDQVTFNLGQHEKCIFLFRSLPISDPFFTGHVVDPIVYENQSGEPKGFDTCVLCILTVIGGGSCRVFSIC